MKYHLVALFDEQSNKRIEAVQKNLYKKYKLNKLNHQFYIHIQTIVDPDIDKLNKVITNILSPYKKFKVQINPSFYYDKSLRTVNLKVEHRGYITRISRNVTETLALNSFNIQNNSNKELYIPIANSTYSFRKSLNTDSNTYTDIRLGSICHDFDKINRLELWKPINNKKENLVKTYPLREY